MSHELRKAESGDARLKLLRETSELTSACVGVDRLGLDAAAELVCRAMADTCVIGVLFDHGGAEITPSACTTATQNAGASFTPPPSSPGNGSAVSPNRCSRSASSGLFVSRRARRRVEHTGSWATTFEDPGIHTALIIPMRALGVAMGIMALARTPPPRPLTRSSPFAQLVGDRLGLPSPPLT